MFLVEEEDPSGEPLFGNGVGDEVGAYVKEKRLYVFLGARWKRYRLVLSKPGALTGFEFESKVLKKVSVSSG